MFWTTFYSYECAVVWIYTHTHLREKSRITLKMNKRTQIHYYLIGAQKYTTQYTRVGIFFFLLVHSYVLFRLCSLLLCLDSWALAILRVNKWNVRQAIRQSCLWSERINTLKSLALYWNWFQSTFNFGTHTEINKNQLKWPLVVYLSGNSWNW